MEDAIGGYRRKTGSKGKSASAAPSEAVGTIDKEKELTALLSAIPLRDNSYFGLPKRLGR
jgi:hypothetical protein